MTEGAPSRSTVLEYTLLADASMAVVSFEGHLTGPHVAVVERCLAEIARERPKAVILNLGSLEDMDEPGVDALKRLQISCREFTEQLRTCGVPAWHRPLMQRLGALNSDETALDLLTAIDSTVGLDLDDDHDDEALS